MILGGYYGFHCQICLAKNKSSNLAPESSYVENEKHRKKIIENAHIIPNSEKGINNPGNLLSLCNFHHHKYGDDFNIISFKDILQENKNKHHPFFDKEEFGYVFQIFLNNEKNFKIFFREKHIGQIIELFNKS